MDSFFPFPPLFLSPPFFKFLVKSSQITTFFDMLSNFPSFLFCFSFDASLCIWNNGTISFRISFSSTSTRQWTWLHCLEIFSTKCWYPMARMEYLFHYRNHESLSLKTCCNNAGILFESNPQCHRPRHTCKCFFFLIRKKERGIGRTGLNQ